MLEVLQNTRINTDASEDDLKPGEYRDALNISLIANELGAFSKGTTYGNIDTNIVFKGLNPDAICLGTGIDSAGTRVIITFYQKVPVPLTPEYEGIINYAVSRGFQVPSPTVQAAQNYLIFLLKQDGIWVGLDVFYCFFGDGDENFAKINWKLPNDATLAVNNGLVYGANYGFKANGTQWLNTKWVPSASVKFTLNDNCFVVGYEEIFQNLGGDGVIQGGNNTYVLPYADPNLLYIADNSGVNVSINDAQITNNEGLIFVSRNSAPTAYIRKNTSSSFALALPSTGLPANPFFIGCIGNEGGTSNFSNNRISMFAAGEYLNTFDRETKFYKNWLAYKNSFVTALVEQAYVQEVLMYLLTDQIGGVVPPLVKSSLLLVSERSYLDGYSFVNELFFFNFRESAPKVINIQRALDSPGFYDNLSETSLTVIKPHPPFSPVAVRALGALVNAPIQKKPFQFMMIYRFVDGEQSTKSPASEYLNSLDDRDAATSLYDRINVTMDFPQKDYSIVKEVELYVRNNNAIADWRSVNVFPRTSFVQAGDNYRMVYVFQDNVVGNFLPLELSTKLNDSIPQRSNYLAFIENRLFLIDSLLDYDFTSTFQILITLDANAATPDDRLAVGPLYGLTEFEYDSEYSVGAAFYDKYGRKYPSSVNDKKLVTPAFVPVALPAVDALPNQTVHAQLNKPKITAKYDMRAAGNVANYGKPPSFAAWWGMIRSKNTKWEFQQSVQCLLRFPYSITKWTDTDPEKFPDVSGGSGTNLFLEDGYLYWHPEKLLYGTAGAGLNLTKTLVNDYIDVVVPPNFPYPLDATILIDFMMQVCTDVNATKITITDREVVETFANKIRIRGDRLARWFSNDAAGLGQYKGFPKFTTGVNLSGVSPTGVVLTKDETTFPLIIKRRRQNALDSIILYDTPQVYPVTNPGTRFCSFQPAQTANIVRAEYPPNYIAPQLARTLAQGDILIQPILLTPTTVAFNHAIKITWGPNVGDALRLKIKVSLWQLNDLNQPILELYSATGDDGGPYSVKNNETAEYLIDADVELVNGWYGYGIQILEATASNVQFENPDFDLQLAGWLQSPEGLPALAWKWASTNGNFAYVDISAMGAGWSRTLYQYLNQVTKDDLTVEVIVEGVGILGPVANSPVNQYPGSANIPLTNNANEALVDLGRNVVPYYIDCTTTPRKVTPTTLSYTLTGVAPAGTLVRAELWLLDQATKSPISMIAGSEGPWTAIGGLGLHTIVFGANKVIDTTGWYGVTLAFDSPTFADFTNKDYANGSASWEIVPAGNPTWVFAPDTSTPPIDQDVLFTPAIGADLGYKPMTSIFGLTTPVFFPLGADPAGYTNHRIIIDWGNNVANGWHGRNIYIAIWDVDQVTKKPSAAGALMLSVTDIRSNGPSEHFISNAIKLTPNKWYGYGILVPGGHQKREGFPFQNSGFGGSLTSWSVTAGSNGSWAWDGVGAGSARAGGDVGAFDTGILYQNMGNHIQVALLIQSGSLALSQITAHLTLNEVVQESIDITAKVSTGYIFDLEFKAVVGTGRVGIKFTGTSGAEYSLRVTCMLNSFNPDLFSSPEIRKYAVASANNESWEDFGPGVVDQDFKEFSKYWLHNNAYKTGSADAYFVKHLAGDVVDPTMLNGDWISVGVSGGYPWSYLGPGFESLVGNPGSGNSQITEWLRSENVVTILKGQKVSVQVGMFGVASANNLTTYQLVCRGLRSVNIPVDPAGGTLYTVDLIADADFCGFLDLQIVTAGSDYGFNVELHGATIVRTAPGAGPTAEIAMVFPFDPLSLPLSKTSMKYSRINMNDVAAPVQTWQINAVGRSDTFGTANLEVWVFNDPATFEATGVRVVNTNVGFGLYWQFVNSPVNIPGGYKYIGYRVVATGDINVEVLRLRWTVPSAISNYESWYKNGETMYIQAKEREQASGGGTILANFHADNINPGVTSGFIGQYNLTGVQVRANIELFAGIVSNNYTLTLYDSDRTVLGSTVVAGQALNVNPQITINAVNPATNTGLFLTIQNNNPVIQQVSDPNMVNPAGWSSVAPGAVWNYYAPTELWYCQITNGVNFSADLVSSNILSLPVGSRVQVRFSMEAPVTTGNASVRQAFLRNGAGGAAISNIINVNALANEISHTITFTLTAPQTSNLVFVFDSLTSGGTYSFQVNVYDIQVIDTPISARIRSISNINVPVTIAADSGAPFKTWQIDNSNNKVQLATAGVTLMWATQDVPQPPGQLTIVLADAAGAEISAQQVFTPNTGQVTLLFAPTFQADKNFNYGVKVKNNAINSQVAGTIRIHSVNNVATNDGSANIIAHTTNPGQPLYEAWNQFSLGAFVRAGYVSNFIAVVDDLIMSAFTPIQINPTSYHLVANIVPAGVEGHSTNYGGAPDSTYNYGIVYPSASSDPDAAGIVYEQKTGQSIGDINVRILDLGEKSQSNIVRWSDPIIIGTRTNNTNAFTDGNKYAVDFQRGSIEVMIAMHDHTLFCVHTQGMSSLYVGRSLVSSPSEVVDTQDQLFLTNRVIGNDNKLTSNLGTINPESVRVVESGTIAYGFDLIRKSFWQKTNNGVRNLTYECNAKNFFDRVCFYRLKAYNEGEDVKIYAGYNEKQKSYYLTFAPFLYRGQAYPAVTVAYNAYIDGFLSRYSFEPISYVATEDVIHTVKAREFTNPDFFGDFAFWKQNNTTGTAVWNRSLVAPVGAKADTTVPGGTRILNPDFIQGPTFWSQYGGGSSWLFQNDGAENTIPGNTYAKDLVNASGAPGTYLLRFTTSLPVTGLFAYQIKVYDNAGLPVETLLVGVVGGDDVVEVTQTLAGRIGIAIGNIDVNPASIHLNLFTTVVKSQLLYQPMPVIKEDLRLRMIIPARAGSIKVLIYAFNDPLNPLMTLLEEVSLIRLKDYYVLNINVPNDLVAKYIGLYTVSDYDTTVIGYFNVNSVPSIWAHDQSGRTNNFFGVQYDSAIELVFNVQAGQVRIFNSLGVMSETAWSVESFVTSEGQLSALDTANFRLRDGVYSASIMRNILTPQDALPDPVNNKPITHGAKMMGVWIKMILRNSETLRRIELRAVYLGSDELSGNLLAKK